jgi:hypothetical protein
VLLRPDFVGESRFQIDSNLSAVDGQRNERRKFSGEQESGSRLAALGLPAWAIAPANSSGPACDDDTGGGGDESVPVRLSYAQRSDFDDDDDESDDEVCDDDEFGLENKRRSRVSAMGETKARAKWSATMAAAPSVAVLESNKRKQAAGQRNSGAAGSAKRPRGSLCRFNGGCDKLIQSNGLCKAHGGGKRCQHAGGCGKSAASPTTYCRAHGGGKRCQHAGGCGKSAESPTSYCVAHGGGKRCQHTGGCGKSAVGPTSYCTAHGGGKRCQHAAGCEKCAQGSTSYCKAHGGGKRCQYAGGCGKSAQIPTSYCMAHGGGRRCDHAGGCNKHVVKKRLCKQHGMAAGMWD